MSGSTIQGKLLALVREYYWREQPDTFKRSFIVGRSIVGGGLGLTWWLTRRGVDRLADLGRLICTELPSLHLDPKTVKEVIEEVLQDNATNRDLFVLDFQRCAATLFESIAVHEHEFAARLWQLVERRLEGGVADWIFVVPL